MENPESFDVVETVNGERDRSGTIFIRNIFETNGYSQIPSKRCAGTRRACIMRAQRWCDALVGSD